MAARVSCFFVAFRLMARACVFAFGPLPDRGAREIKLLCFPFLTD
jgi:hypothetical protein